MSTVMYSPGSNRGNNQQRRSSSNPGQGARSMAGISGSILIAIFGYFTFQAISLLLVSVGTGGAIVLSILVVAPAAIGLYMLFEERKYRSHSWLTFSALGLWAATAIPGLPQLIGIVCVSVTAFAILYMLVLQASHSHRVACFITAIPLVGGFFFVQSRIDSLGLVNSMGRGEFAVHSTSPIASELQSLYSGMAVSYPGAAIVSYQIRNNRLYADIIKNGSLKTLQLGTPTLTSTPVSWLEWNLQRRLDGLIDKSRIADNLDATELANLLKPVVAELQGAKNILVADGSLVNCNHQQFFGNSRILRSVSLDAAKATPNMASWASHKIIRTPETGFFNLLPQNAEELGNLGLSARDWKAWSNFHALFTDSLPQTGTWGKPTKTDILNALKNKKAALFVIAHSDGFSIRLPNGEVVSADDLSGAADAIRANRPDVFLFSCETARIENLQSFAKILLDHGAASVAAAVGQVSPPAAYRLFHGFSEKAFGKKPLSAHEAFEQAAKETGVNDLEVWVARNFNNPDWKNE